MSEDYTSVALVALAVIFALAFVTLLICGVDVSAACRDEVYPADRYARCDPGAEVEIIPDGRAVCRCPTKLETP